MKRILFVLIGATLYAQTSIDPRYLPDPKHIPDPKHLKEDAAKIIDDEIQEGIKKSKEKEKEKEEQWNPSGFILGVSMGLKTFSAEQIIKGFETLSTQTPALNGGIILGYQGFLNPYIGMRISTRINVGTHATIKAETLTPAFPTGTAPSTPIKKITQTYIPIQSGVDLSLFLSLYSKNDYALGISAGIDYEFDWYVVQKADSHTGTTGALTNILQKPSDIINHGIYPKFGIFYFQGNHQFEVAYRFAEFSFLGEEYHHWDFNANHHTPLATQTKFFKTSEIILSYLYRF